MNYLHNCKQFKKLSTSYSLNKVGASRKEVFRKQESVRDQASPHHFYCAALQLALKDLAANYNEVLKVKSLKYVKTL